MVIPKINSAHGSDTRNIINTAIDSINAQGKSIQDLVAEGQLTPTQYAELIQAVNGLISKGDVKLDDLSPEILEAINNSDGTPINVLSIPRDGSVTPEKTTFLMVGKNLFNKDDVVANKSINTSTGLEMDSEYYDLYQLSVNPNENYTQNLSFVVAEYDEDGVFNRETLLPFVQGYNAPRTMTTSSTASYVKIAVQKDQLSNFQFEKGTEFTRYEEYGLKLKNVTTDFSEILTQQNEEWVI